MDFANKYILRNNMELRHLEEHKEDTNLHQDQKENLRRHITLEKVWPENYT